MILSVPYPRAMMSLLALVSLSVGGVLPSVRGDEGFVEGAVEGPADREETIAEELLSFFEDLVTVGKNVAEGAVALNDTALQDLEVRSTRALAYFGGIPSPEDEDEQGHGEDEQGRPRMLNTNLSEKLQTCRDGRKTCNQDLVALKREKNKATRDLDKCVTDLAGCDDDVESFRDARDRARGNFERCRVREDQCQADLEHCRSNTHMPTSLSTSFSPTESVRPSISPSSRPSLPSFPSPQPSLKPSMIPSSWPSSMDPTEMSNFPSSLGSWFQPSAIPSSSSRPTASSRPSLMPTSSSQPTTTAVPTSPGIPSPCDSYQEVVHVPENEGWKLCQMPLKENTAYLLSGDIRCHRRGLVLATRSCLDCRGHSVTGFEFLFPAIEIPRSGGNSYIHNCMVDSWRSLYGIHVYGDDNVISNVVVKNGWGGIDIYGSNNRVSCSALVHTENGLEAFGSSISITGCFLEDNGSNYYYDANVAVSCSKFVRQRYGVDFSDATTSIENTIFIDADIDIYYEQATSLSNVVMCNSDYDWNVFKLGYSSDGHIRWRNLTCDDDSIRNDSPVLPTPVCETQCPSDTSSIELPPVCDNVCPHGVGTYDPDGLD